MSKIFMLRPKKRKELKTIKKMKIGDFLSYMDDGYDFNVYYDEDFLSNKIEDNVLLIGRETISARGFEFSCEDKYFEMRINTPATSGDWKTLINFIQDLAEKTNSTIQNEDEEYLSIDEIQNFDYEPDILLGISMIKEHLGESESLHLPTGDAQVIVDEEMFQTVIDAENKIEAFDKMIEEVIFNPAYFAKQQFFMKNDTEELIGYYVLSHDLDTILPTPKPSLTYDNLWIEKEYGTVSQWLLAIVFDDDSTIKSFDYAEALEKLKPWNKIDSGQIEVSAKTGEDLAKLFEDLEEV